MIEQFLRERKLGPIRIGMSEDEVRALLGEPEDKGTQPRQDQSLWRYKCLQLGFVQGRVQGIYIYLTGRRQPLLPPPLASQDFRSVLNRRSFLDFVDGQQIPCSQIRGGGSEEYAAFRVGEGIIATFDSTGALKTLTCSGVKRRDSICPVCQEPYSEGEIVKRCAECDQYFHLKCWPEETAKCPRCRKTVIPGKSVFLRGSIYRTITPASRIRSQVGAD